ncbi:MAG: outer membrane beta-barrel domain-containing protein [Dissulfurispiraceae bacterium]|jgi:OOP family OmpA-OmpF porin
MKTMYRAALMAVVFVFLLPLTARSEIKEGSFELEPFGGYTLFEHSQNLENRPEFGGRFGYNFTKYFGVEGTVEFMDSHVADMSITSPREGRFISPMNRVDVTFYHIDAVYTFLPDGKFNPFVLAGFGGAHYSSSTSNRDLAAFNVGIGAKYWASDHVAFRVDMGDYMVTELFHETRHNPRATAGITLALGGEAKPAPKPVTETISEPKAEEPVVIIVSEPKAEEKVMVLASEPKIEDKVIVLALEDVHFDFDKSTLTKEAQAILKRNLKILQENPKAKVRIAGYTSASGTEEYNQKLSERRANAVKDYLVEEGIVTPDRLSEIGYGKTKPAMYEAAPKDLYSEAAKANMRVLFEIIVK